ncbi:putative proteasome subunit alpha type-2 [Catenaria anguillulae PL171]|uniref:Proteasome subunit alpha type n=1 Tax=Catenaria anguillulae PL171 TaxID=765915 RepID=A0A1Y2HES1_9FUNG|nr:putative proteasome subunit alpha type-2 [Catenaria anguillulae PL171]
MGDRYSFSLTTFSPSGKLVQIEYALNAVSKGLTSIGINYQRHRHCHRKEIRLGAGRRPSLEWVAPICPTIGVVYSGMGPDARLLISKARKAAQQYKRVYMQDPPVAILVQEIAAVMQEYTQSGGVRPFGVSLLVAGWDEHRGHSLYQVDPSGTYFGWKATAIGKNMLNAKTFLEKRFSDTLELDDAIHTAILTLKEGIEGQLNENSLEIGIITMDHDVGVGVEAHPSAEKEVGAMRFRKLLPHQVRDYLENIA